MYQTNKAAAQPQQPQQQQQFQQQQPMIIMQPTIAVPPTATYQQQRPLLQQQQQPANLSNSLMSFCCGGCRKNGFANNPQTQLLNPSVSNNYLYQQHFQHLQQPKQQRLQQQQQQASATIPTSSFIPGCGGQQRYVGGTTTNYLMPQSQQQQQSQSQQANIMSPSRNIGAYGTITSSSQQPHHQSQSQYGKQLLSTSSPLNGPYHQQQHGGGGRIVSDMMIITQPEQFRSRISGLTSDVFRQIEQVEQQFDPNSLANIQYSELENRGEMIIRIISPTQLLSQWLDDSIRRFGDCYGQLPSWIQFVEIIKRPGQTLGLYIREGDGLYTMDGVYISRIALESSVYQSGCLRVGDEILAINFVDVSRMSLDDVVLIMSIPRRLILTIRSRPLNAEHMLTNRNIYGTGMSDSCYYDTVAGDIYSRVDDLRLQQQQNNNKPVVVVKQKQQQFTETTTAADLLLDEDDEEEVYQAATAAAEAGLLDDPSTAAAAAVAGLQDPTPAKAAAAVAAVNEIIVRSGSSLELYGGIGGSRPGSSLMMATARQRYRNHRRLFTSDNLADLYQSEMERAEINNNLYMPGRRGTLPTGSLITATSATTMINQKPLRTPLSSLYHGRLAHHHQQGSSRSRSATGRLMRTSSEQMIYGGYGGLGLHQQQDPVDQIDHFLQRYQSAKQSMRHRPPSSSRIRHHSFDQSAMLRNSYSTQSLLGNSNYLTGSVGIGGSTSTGISQQHGMAIPLPGMAEAVAIARRRYLRGETTNAGDGSGNIFDTGNYSDTEQQKYRARVDQQHSNNRSNSLPRAPGSGLSGSRHSSSHHHHHHRASSSLSNRLQQLEQLYSSSSSTTKNPRLSSSIRPHSAMADNYSNKDIIDDDYSTSAELLAQMRRNVHDQRNQYSGQQQRLSSTTRLDSLRASLAESSSSSTEDILGKNNRSLTSSSRTAAAAGGAGGGASLTSAIYETIRKSKMAQDLQQPQSGRLAISGQIMMMNTDDMKTRYSNLQMTKNSSDSSGFHHQNRPPYDMLDQGSVHQRQPQTSAAGAATTTSSLIGQISTRPSRILMIDPSGFQQYGPDLHRQQQSTTAISGSSSGKMNDGQIAGYSGLLVIHLLGVRGLQFDHLISAKNLSAATSTATAATTKRVLYSVVECDRIYKARTVAVQSHENNNTNFDWDEVFDIDLFDTKEVSFLFYTWDQSLPDLNMRHKQCSKGTIHLPSIPGLITQHVHAFELRLYDTPGAMFYIKLEYHDLTQTFKRSKRSGGGVGGNLRTTNRSSIGGNIGGNEQPLFGVDLETIIQREQSGYSIPIIIKRCCDEIEKRGLYMLGIYRLCGSSLVKRTLRESFEKNSWLADISLENVPDINVITSLLKDYLRELPEPLFNKAMFDMMDDGLSVCVPDDPTGNAKLMFSILECLPKSHRNTVLYLMDHIKLIHINSDRNKMTSQALAICFGPLFSCHDQSDSVYKPIQVFKFLLDIWPRRKGAMNMLKKSDDFNPQSSLMDGGTASLSTTTTIASNIRSPSYRSPMIADSFTTTTSSSVDHPHHHHQQQHLYDSPSDPSSSSYRFQSNILQMDGSPTKLSTALTTATTTTTTSISGTGRLLPSTQNATRTISAYSSATNSISKYKVPAGSTGPLMLNSSNAGVTATTTTAITTTTTSSSRISSIDSILSSSSPYRSRYGTSSMNATSSLDSNNDIRTSATSSSYRFSTSSANSDYYSKDSSLIGGGGTTSGGLSSSRSPYLSSSSSLQKNHYTDSEVIDQTYKKYLNNPSTTTTTISSSSISDIMITSSTTTATNEGLYSTVNKPSLMSTTKRSLLFEDSNRILNKTNDPLQDDDDDGGGGSLSSIKNLRSSSSYLNDNNDLPSSTTLSSSYHHNHNSPTKPLITGSGPSSTQLYPSRLNNIISSSSSGSNTMITSSYTTGYSSLSSSSLLGRNIDDTSASNPTTTSKFASSSSSSMTNHNLDRDLLTGNDYNASSSRKIGGSTTSSTIYSTINNDDDSSSTTTMNKIQSIIDHSGNDSGVGTSYGQQYQTPLISSRHYSSSSTNDYPHRHHQQKHLDDDNVL